ncbi:TPA: hypothetical protein RQN15_002200 [Aeromonas hydrophila]|nr:hypothetical protein [Aeromonas hydrophila]
MKTNNLQFFYNTTPTDCFGTNGARKTYWVEHLLSSIKFRSTEDDKVMTLSEMTVKEFFKHLTKCGFGADTTDGKAIRRAIKLSLAQLITAEFTHTLMDDKFYFYLDADTSDVVMIKAKEIEHQNTISHEAFIITRKEDKAGVSVYMSHGKQYNSISKDRKSMMIKTDFEKVETRGRKAKRVELPIAIDSTPEENNAVTVEIKEVTNHNATMLEEVAAELAELKAQREKELAEIEAMKAKHEAEMAQLRAMFSSNRGSIFSRPTATAKQEALSELETLKTQFDIDSEIERL